MWRIIIILVLLIILYFMVRSSLREFFGKKKPDPVLPAKDVMVQDPVCKAYIPAGSAKSEKIGGQQYYFCGDECADKFKSYMSG
ncbi:MAG: YHS domain-containing protein [Nitrospirae bacterium]|nr:YHS domain-containing protein [Nitrospirota bacterium]MDA1304997.1 YHS domain-containing protein [Nitrospirota bacterium]